MACLSLTTSFLTTDVRTTSRGVRGKRDKLSGEESRGKLFQAAKKKKKKKKNPGAGISAESGKSGDMIRHARQSICNRVNIFFAFQSPLFPSSSLSLALSLLSPFSSPPHTFSLLLSQPCLTLLRPSPSPSSNVSSSLVSRDVISLSHRR